jgi:GTPase SAR1 family protein
LFERPIIMGCQSSKDNAPPSPVNITGGYDYRIQFLLLGPEAVGKTAIITQFVENKIFF